MALSAEQLADLQGDLGITDDETVFTDAELNRLFTRANENYPGAVFLGYRQLLASAAKFRDYSMGMSSEKRSQIFKHLKDMLEFWRGEVTNAGGQVLLVGLQGVPTHHKDRPWRMRDAELGDLDWVSRSLGLPE
jgi:hypothetical protein